MEFYALTRKSNVVFFGENSMNKSFKVVFNKARGALMVVNEVTSSVQAKGTKTVIAAAVAALAASGAMATEWVKAPEELKTVQEEQKWEVLKEGSSFAFVLDDKAEKKQGAFLAAKTEGLTFDKDLWVSGNTSDAQATGISAVKVKATNTGRIFVTSGENGKAWKNHGMLAENGGTAVNDGLIVAKNGYGMAVETAAPASTIINNDRIVVEDTGVGMELGGADDSEAVNNGTIVANTPVKGGFSHGVLIKDQDNAVFTNKGTINASAEGATAIEIQVEKATTKNAEINLEKGSSVNGLIHNHEGVEGTKLKANGFVGTIDLKNDSEEGMTVEVNQGADLTLADGHGSKVLTAVVNDGMLSASIWQKYTVGEGEEAKEASDNQFKNVTVNEGGIFNVKQLNSGGTKDKSHDTLLIKGSEWTLDGGALQVDRQNFTGNLKVGTASDESSFTIESGDYSYNTLTVGREGTTNVNGGTLTVGDLTLLTKKGVLSNGSLRVGGDATLTVNGVLTANGDFVEGKGMTVEGDLVLGEDASLALKAGALRVTGEMTATGEQIFTKNGESYVVSDQAKLIDFGADSGLLITNTFSTSQDKLQTFLSGLAWEGAPAIVFTGVTFEGAVEFNTALGYNGLNSEVNAGESTGGTVTLSADKDVAVGALKVDANTTKVAIENQATGENGTEFVFAGLGGNIITGVNEVESITANGEVTLGWDETSTGVVNAGTLNVKDLSVAGQFVAKNVVVENGGIDEHGSLTLDKLLGTGTFGVSQAATLDVHRIEIVTNLEAGATLVIGDRLAADTTEGVATLADEQLDAQIAAKVTVTEADSIATTNANGRNLLKAVAGDKYDAATNSGLYVDDTVAVDREKGKLFIGNAVEDGKEFGDIGLGASSVTVIDVSAFADGQAIFVADKLHVNKNSTILLKGADRVGSFTLVEGGEVNDISFVNDVLKAGDTNAWLGYTVAKGTEENAADTFLNVAFEKQNNVSAEVNAFAESVLTAGSESLGVVNAIGTTYRDETTGGLSNVGAEALDEYMALPAVAGTYNAAYDAAEQVWNTIGAHNIDRTVGKTNGVWADVFYSANEAGDMYGNGYGYEADVYGGVLGYDYTAACGGKIGAALTIGTSDVDAKGDFIGDYGNDADFWGLSIYASKDITEKMIVSADITYLSLDNDIKGSVAGASVAESIDSSVISVGLRADWKAYESNAFEIVPHAGIRYAQIDVDDYREMDGESLDVLEMPIGVAFNGKFEAAGMKFVPTLDFTVVPQIGDTEVHPLNGDTLDVLNNTYNTTLGISAEYGDFTFGVAAKYGFGTDDRSNAGVKVNATYAF